ncbi:MAG: response regulator transcription factor [Clostridiales bacterium]|jgi:DNA-binding response OmpR family regulator|nr:response regulator transcription factor [Clostridiales bacterium]
MNDNKILIVDDDRHIAELIALYLDKEGFVTRQVHTGGSAMAEFAAFSPHLVLLDLMLPEKDGHEICREIRKVSAVPIIMLTAKGEVFDKVLGLTMGADDYIVKPFDGKELVARVKAVLRRYDAGLSAEDAGQRAINIPNLSINPATYNVVYHGRTLELPPKEFELLHFLLSHPGRVFTRNQLLDNIWGYDFFGDSRTVDVHIKRIREKLEHNDTWSIKTVWGVGYKFELKTEN